MASVTGRKLLPVLDARSARRLRSNVVAYVRARLNDVGPIEDIAHEALVRLLHSRSRARGDLATRARRIAARLIAEYEGHRGPWRTEEAALAYGRLAQHQVAPDPQVLYELRVTHDCLVGAFGRLPIDARRLIMLHDVAEIPLKEIAATFGCSATSAKVRLRRARIRLSEICQAECGSDVGPDGVIMCLPKEGSTFASYGRADRVAPRAAPARPSRSRLRRRSGRLPSPRGRR
jgi:RNA polymerase sigma-70 factor (ECF subfamily)